MTWCLYTMYAASMTLTKEQTTIRDQREARGWSRARLAREAGITEQTIYRAEHGKHEPADTTMDAIAAAFDRNPVVQPIRERAHGGNVHGVSAETPEHPVDR